MKIVVAGGSGFLGQLLVGRLASTGHSVTVLTRGGAKPGRSSTVRYLVWDPENQLGNWTRELDGADAVINLAGAGIADRRWSADRKEILRSSRVLATRGLVTAIRAATARPTVFIQGSAVGFYGTADGDRELDESFPPGTDFLGGMCVAWEAEAHPVAALGCRLIFIRSGVVLAKSGGALPKLLLPFQMFAGGPMASGGQYMSWIHAHDWAGLVVWALSSPHVSGVLNATAPVPVTNDELSKALGRAVRRPSWLRVPGFALRAIVGEMASASLIEGQRVVPRRPLALGFTFAHPTIEEALKDAVRHADAPAPSS